MSNIKVVANSQIDHQYHHKQQQQQQYQNCSLLCLCACKINGRTLFKSFSIVHIHKEVIVEKEETRNQRMRANEADFICTAFLTATNKIGKQSSSLMSFLCSITSFFMIYLLIVVLSFHCIYYKRHTILSRNILLLRVKRLNTKISKLAIESE